MAGIAAHVLQPLCRESRRSATPLPRGAMSRPSNCNPCPWESRRSAGRGRAPQVHGQPATTPVFGRPVGRTPVWSRGPRSPKATTPVFGRSVVRRPTLRNTHMTPRALQPLSLGEPSVGPPRARSLTDSLLLQPLSLGEPSVGGVDSPRSRSRANYNPCLWESRRSGGPEAPQGREEWCTTTPVFGRAVGRRGHGYSGKLGGLQTTTPVFGRAVGRSRP